MSGYREISLRVLVSEHDADEVSAGLINLAVHDASLGAFTEEREVLPDDETWAPIIHDREEPEVPADGSLLTLTLPRDDFALLMDTIARCAHAAARQGQKLTITDSMVNELSRVASDLGQQADDQ